MQRQTSPACPDCSLDRRHFLAGAAGAALAAATFGSGRIFAAESEITLPTRESKAETAVSRLFDSLNDEQKKLMALPLSDERRNTINANWHITEAKIGEAFDKEQQETIREIVRGVTSEDGFERLMKQMQADAGGFNNYAVAVFGSPHEEEFEFELTGRHLTLRADGNTKKGVAFGGPIVYGHGAAGNSGNNLFNYQTKQANEVFKMLDGTQREAALIAEAPREGDVELRREGRPIPGIAGADLSGDQKERLKKSLEGVMQPYRAEDVAEVMQIMEAGGGLDAVRMSFYKQGDLGEDQEWDIWRLESPTLVCHFRGAPHVHAYINVRRQA